MELAKRICRGFFWGWGDTWRDRGGRLENGDTNRSGERVKRVRPKAPRFPRVAKKEGGGRKDAKSKKHCSGRRVRMLGEIVYFAIITEYCSLKKKREAEVGLSERVRKEDLPKRRVQEE